MHSNLESHLKNYSVLGEEELVLNEYRVSVGEHEHVLEMNGVMAAQLCECTQHH